MNLPRGRRALVIAVLVVGGLALGACGASPSGTAAGSTGGGSSSSSGGTSASAVYGAAVSKVASDLTTVGTDAGTASTDPSQANFNVVATDCQNLLQDTQSVQNLPQPSGLSDQEYSEFQGALDQINSGAQACITGSQNQDSTQLVTAANDFTAADSTITNIDGQLGATQS